MLPAIEAWVAHLLFQDRKRLLAQMLLYESLSAAEVLPTSDERLINKLAEELLRLLQSAEYAAAQDDSQSLTDYLSDFSRRAELLLQLFSTSPPPPVRRWLDQFLARIAASTCCSRSGTSCRGRPGDDSLLASTRGYEVHGCLFPVRQAFDEVLVWVNDAYRVAVPGFVDAFVVRLGTGRARKDVSLGGFTLPPTTPGTVTAILEINPDCLDDDAYFAVRYVLMHECFVHAYQAWPAEGREALAMDSFAEGWLDWIAFEQLAARSDAAILSSPGPNLLRWTRVLRASQEYHNRRVRGGDNTRFAAPRKLGRLAAISCRAFFVELFALDGEELFLRLSLELNTRVASLSLRASFVAFVNYALGSDELPEKFVLEHWLRRYARSETTAEELVTALSRV
jgi:hypothetical protein